MIKKLNVLYSVIIISMDMIYDLRCRSTCIEEAESMICIEEKCISMGYFIRYDKCSLEVG